MCDILRVQWTIVPRTAPQPWISCSGCGGLKPFQTSGKIRLNANGKKLDAWLIYKCLVCDKTWNRSIFERQNVRDIDRNSLQALHTNDPEWIRTQAFDIGALRRDAHRIDEFGEIDVQKIALNKEGGDRKTLEIELAVPLPARIRLDRLLASELGISRSRLQELHDGARLKIDPDHKGMLRLRIKHRSRITLNLAKEADRQVVLEAAASGPPKSPADPAVFYP
jgi:hypothetical protein